MDSSRSVRGRKSFAEKISYHLEHHEEDYDLIFSVGPKQEFVKASRLVLAVSSPIFKTQFLNNVGQCFESQVLDENSNFKAAELPIISIPNTDPKVFRIFLKLLLWDDTSVDKLVLLNLSLEDVVCLLELCKEYEVIQMQKDVELLLHKYIRNFPRFIHTKEFLHLPEKILERVLKMDYLALDEITIFAYVCKWAEIRCQQRNILPTGENIRMVLGKCFDLIRFPVMTVRDFRCRVSPTNILNVEEELALFKHITLTQKDRQESEVSKGGKEEVMGFCAVERSKFSSDTMCIFNHFHVVDDPPFVCKSLSELHCNYFKINSRVAIISVGFLGPIKASSWYEVDVEIKSYPSLICHGKLQKKVYARKQKIFRVEFDSPVILDPNSAELPEIDETILSDGWYEIEFVLKGANTQSMILSQDTTRSVPLQTECSFKICSKTNDVQFDCFWESSQLAEISYERLWEMYLLPGTRDGTAYLHLGQPNI